MLYITISLIAGALSGYITARIMASKLIKKLDAIDIEYRKKLFEISIEAIDKLSQNTCHNSMRLYHGIGQNGKT